GETQPGRSSISHGACCRLRETILQQAELRRRESDVRSGIRQQWRVPLRCANAESVRFLPRVEYFRIASQCGTHFLLSCRPTTTKGGRKQGAASNASVHMGGALASVIRGNCGFGGGRFRTLA